LRCGRDALPEVRVGTEVSEDSSASSMVNGEGWVEGELVLCSVWRSCPARFGSSGVVSISDGSAGSLAGSKTRGLFEGVDGAASPLKVSGDIKGRRRLISQGAGRPRHESRASER